MGLKFPKTDKINIYVSTFCNVQMSQNKHLFYFLISAHEFGRFFVHFTVLNIGVLGKPSRSTHSRKSWENDETSTSHAHNENFQAGSTFRGAAKFVVHPKTGLFVSRGFCHH